MGPQKDFINKQDQYFVFYSFSESVYSYSYCVINTGKDPIEITVDLKSQSKNMLTTPSQGTVTRQIKPGQMSFLMHTVADPKFESFSKKCIVHCKGL